MHGEAAAAVPMPHRCRTGISGRRRAARHAGVADPAHRSRRSRPVRLRVTRARTMVSHRRAAAASPRRSTTPVAVNARCSRPFSAPSPLLYD